MLVTEEEAKKKWCPMYRCSTDNGQLSDNATHSKGGYCCASDCMSWRWWDKEWGIGNNKDVLNPNRRGYCGLSGKPEEG